MSDGRKTKRGFMNNKDEALTALLNINNYSNWGINMTWAAVAPADFTTLVVLPPPSPARTHTHKGKLQPQFGVRKSTGINDRERREVERQTIQCRIARR
ncbi:hypothetical protein J6590_024153 [Homalodisca vitripennis]|nr:hypothetical protein J6590_024153 [Homalodisca vitripennis]